MNRPNEEEVVGEIGLDKMKKYISYCKALVFLPSTTFVIAHDLTSHYRKCAPRLSQEASEMLSSHFVSLRKQVQQVERDNDERSSIPITVRSVSSVREARASLLTINYVLRRQLEAIIRISEALAKLTLSTTVQAHHVEESIRLFKYSTMDAVSSGSVDGLSRGELNDEVQRIETEVRRRLPVGWSTSYQALVKEFVQSQDYSQHALDRTLYILEKREVIRFSGQVRYISSRLSYHCTEKIILRRTAEKSCPSVCGFLTLFSVS
jgi:DNA replication licensing factor MCM5